MRYIICLIDLNNDDVDLGVNESLDPHPDNCHFGLEFTLPDGTEDFVAVNYGRGLAFMADYSASDTNTCVYAWCASEKRWIPL